MALLCALAACSAPEAQPAPDAAAGRPPAPMTDEEAARVRALPYAAWTPVSPVDGAQRGVVLHDRERAVPGLNLYSSSSRGRAWLIDMDGRVVASWSNGAGQPAPGAPLLPMFFGWQHVLATPDGGLIALVNRHRVLRLDARSRLVWSVALPAHHELAPAPGGEVLTLVDAPRIVVVRGRRRLVLDDQVVRLGGDGTVRSRRSLWDALSADPATAAHLEEAVAARYEALDRAGLEGLLAGSGAAGRPPGGGEIGEVASVASWLEGPRLPPDVSRETLSRLRAVPGSPVDALHANSIQLVARAVPGVAEAGDLLVAIRELDLVAVVGSGDGRLRWSWGPGVLERPHQPSFLPSGRLLVFDNGPFRRRSRVLEVDPSSGRITWVYGDRPGEEIFSPGRGGCQGLPGGDVLITDSASGRAFEVTRDGRLVWELLNPEVNGDRRATIYRLHRITGDAADRLAARLDAHLHPR